jgi:hypothetical protein
MKAACFMLSPFSMPPICPDLRIFIVRISLQRSPRRLERKEAHPQLDQSFYEAVILLGQIVEVLTLPQFTNFGDPSRRLQFSERLR